MSGGLATAEALGRFGALGVHSAFYWTYPPEDSPAFWAFRAYRNFDGAGARFEDRSLPTTGSGAHGSLFASLSSDRRRLVAVMLNFELRSPLATQLDLGTCGEVEGSRVFSYAGTPGGFAPAEPARLAAPGAEVLVPPFSISVIELKLKPPSP